MREVIENCFSDIKMFAFLKLILSPRMRDTSCLVNMLNFLSPSYLFHRKVLQLV
jgi:hypothetical protein